MKVLLIEPPCDRFVDYSSECLPLSLSYLSGFLNRHGHEVSVYNADHARVSSHINIIEYSENQKNYLKRVHDERDSVWQEISKVIREHQPQVIGITVMSVKLLTTLKLIELIRKINPEITIVCGGHHPTIQPKVFLDPGRANFVVRGEGEITLHELIQALETNTEEYDRIKGLSYRRGEEIVNTPQRALIEDLDSLPLPEKERIVFKETYSPEELSVIMTSRGCPYACKFCGSGNMWHRAVRYRSVDSVLEEIEILKRTYQVSNIKFMDDCFTVNKKRVRTLCQNIIDRKLNITWSCLTRVNLIDEQTVALMKRAGCTKVDVGIESGNARILKVINKGITLSQVEAATKILNKHKILWAGFFMFGFPTETEEEVLDTLNYIKKLKPGWVNMSIFTPYPGTELYDLAREKGIIGDDYDPSLYMHQRVDNYATDVISKEKFDALARTMLTETNKYNHSFSSLFKRALSRKYHKNVKLLYQDFLKVKQWAK